jgi:hypothetical protein
MTRVTAVLSSLLAPVLARYVDLKQALRRGFDNPTRTLATGPIPPQASQKLPRSECRCVSNLVPDPGTCDFRCAT